MAATIKDIARRLNISTSTVSYALNGGPRTVPEEVKERVLSVARELGYRPNRIARSMVTRRTATYGVVPTEPAINLAISPFFQIVLNGILNAAEDFHRDVLIYTGYDHRDLKIYTDNLLDGRADGLIFIAPPLDTPIFPHIRRAGIPFVITNSRAAEGAPNITVNNRTGVVQALEHLLELGHRKIGFLYGKKVIDDGLERYEQFVEFFQRRGLPVREDWMFDGDFTQNGGESCAGPIAALRDRPTAFFCANDEMAVGLINGLRHHGIRVPTDLSVVGFDDSTIAHLMQPQITTVRQPLEEIGAAAVHALQALIEGREAAPRQFSTRLVVRASSERPLEDTKKS
ncbi:MAG: LacI family DNA-binding transcriptional regulator [Fimbriimonadaceae bacterium]|nr:LacI family DNA-binding transcriptional regulator [Fimbriimonadaceae bacterium]